MSPVNRLNSYFLTKIQDKRLEIEMRSMRQSLRDEEENVETFEEFPDGGDKLLDTYLNNGRRLPDQTQEA